MTSAVQIVIVNYRTADLTIDCLYSIAEQAPETSKLHVWVVDNASGDGSPARIVSIIETEGWHAWISLIPLDRNGGFAFGSNAGIRESLRSVPPADYVMLLNPDTLVLPGAIAALVGFMESQPNAGIAGSLLENAAGEVECSAHNTPTPLGELEATARLGVLSRLLSRYRVTPPPREVAHECEWVSGASLMIRRAVIEQIGLLDEEYFLYFEEVDYCLRARKASWQIWFVPDSRIVHFEGATTGIRRANARRIPYWYDSRRRYFLKHFGVSGLFLADALWSLGRMSLALRRAVRLGTGGTEQDPKWFAYDLLWGDLRSLFNGTMWSNTRRRQ